MHTLDAILRFIDGLNDWVGRILSFGVLIMFALVLTEVIRRYFFNSPTVWGNELTQLVFGVYVILSGGHILRWNGHVNVDILHSRFSEKGRAVADIFTFSLFFMFGGMMFYFGGSLAWESLTTLEHSQSAWNPPLYPFKLMIPIGALFLLLQGFAKLMRDILVLVPRKEIPGHEIGEGETR